MRKRNPELFWNVETLARALDASIEQVALWARHGMIPLPAMVGHTPLWRATDVREWARQLALCEDCFLAMANIFYWQHEKENAHE